MVDRHSSSRISERSPAHIAHFYYVMTSAAIARVGEMFVVGITLGYGTPVMSVDALSSASRCNMARCDMVKSGANDALLRPNV